MPNHHQHPGYAMPRQGGLVLQMAPRDHRGYDMYDADHDSLSGSGAPSSTTASIYEDDHNRGDLAFGDRMY